MAEEIYDNLKEMYDSFFDESQKIKKQLEKNLNSISEIDSYLEKLHQKEESDYKVFSPRSFKDIYKNDIDEKIKQKTFIENENQNYYKSINKLDFRIRTISSVLNLIEKNSQLSDDSNYSLNNNIQTEHNSDDNMERRLYILDIQEKERQRIARDLHDSSLQNLAHLTHKIELASMYIDDDKIKAKLELAAVNKELKSIIQEIRNTIFDLRPMSFDDLGLKESLERLIDRFKETSSSEFQIDIQDINCDNSLLLMTVFRIIEECMNNAVKHSSGNLISLKVKLTADNNCKIIVTDNGKGFNSEKVLSEKDRHFGLCILKERVSLLSGSITIDSDLNKGTIVNIEIPL